MQILDRRKRKKLIRKKLIYRIGLPTITNIIYDKDGFLDDVELIFGFPNEDMQAAFNDSITFYLDGKNSINASFTNQIVTGIKISYIMVFKTTSDLTKFKLKI